MSKHFARIAWRRESPDFSYGSYNRSHQWTFDSGISVEATAAVGFLGTADRVDPEEAFVAAISSCHMLTFLAICARKRIIVDSYEDAAVGYMEKNDREKLAVTRVCLYPEIAFGGTPPSVETIRKIHHQSHNECFIANSVTTEITVESL
ncbi:MAG: OsmC family peroxiredoxin [Gammaproteobacteria bacterium]|jgi:organic hydroperoxide reductase OsmC/OhrA|nr:OsmC family peroxiredoxin [Gammaproteobacteria bacterium]